MEGEVTFKEIERARDVMRKIVRMAPLNQSRTLSRLTGMSLYLKLENLGDKWTTA
jgi:threonine dehydratase